MFISSEDKSIQADRPQDLLELQEQGLLEQLPARGNDELLLISRANKEKAYVLTNDNFEEHVRNGVVSAYFRCVC
jgi:hypothetical protein